MGFDLTEAELRTVTARGYWSEHWTGEAFAEALLRNDKYLRSDILQPYREGGNRSGNPFVNFYWDYCSQGEPCYSTMTFPNMRDVIDIIHRNGGKSVLAHPGVNLRQHRTTAKKSVIYLWNSTKQRVVGENLLRGQT